jgi:RHS repeat-associated protein
MQRNVYYDKSFAPFGDVYNETGSAERSFTGQANNLTTGLFDFLFREYDPTQGRWLQPDPAGLGAVDPTNPQSWNRYGYVGGNPLALVDPLGLDGYYCPSEGNCVWVSSNMSEGEANYVNNTVIPGYLAGVGARYPAPTIITFPIGAMSATISFGQNDYAAQIATLSALSVAYSDAMQASDVVAGDYSSALNLVGQNVDAQKAFLAKALVGAATVGVGGAGFATLTGISSVSGLTTVATGGEAIGVEGLSASQVTLVSRWGAQGLQAGNWVMRGGTGATAYVLSGKWQPGFGNQFASFTSGQNYLVPSSAVQYPGWVELGLGWIKGLLGQRIYWP